MGDGESEKGESKRMRPVVEEVPQEDSSRGHNEMSSGEAEDKAREVLEELNRTPSNRNEETSNPSVGGKKSKISSKLLIFVIIVTAILVAVVSGGVYVYYNSLLEEGEKEVVEEVVATPSPTVTTPSPSPTPTPSPEPVDLSEFKLSVQNGSGIIGEASKVEDLLTEEGFSGIETENAARFDFENTVVRVKENVPSVVVAAIEDILRKGEYEFEVEDEFLPDDFDFEIVVIVGASS